MREALFILGIVLILGLKLIPRLVSSTAKVRRLGYFTALCSITSQHNVPERLLPLGLHRWAEKHRASLERYSKSLPVARKRHLSVVGRITGQPDARRYIDTAREMGLIISIGREWQNTKEGHIIARVPSAKDNVFKLSLAQRFLLLRLLLEKDYFYLRALYELIATKAPTNDSNEFRKQVESSIDFLLARERGAAKQQALRAAKRKLWEWHDSETYYRDHIRAPRLEWLLDLGLLIKWNQKVNYFALAPNSEKFFSASTFDARWMTEWYSQTFYDTFLDMFPRQTTTWNEKSEQDRTKLMRRYLAKAIEIFRPSRGLDKISAWQFTNYVACILSTKRGIVTSHDDVERALVTLTAGASGYRYVKMTSGADLGYIVRKHS